MYVHMYVLYIYMYMYNYFEAHFVIEIGFMNETSKHLYI